MKLIDSHCHLNFPEFRDNYKYIIADCLKKEIGVINIGANFLSSKRAVEIADEFLDDSVYASIGIHPSELEKEKFEKDKFKNLLKPKVVAIGEIGLDYFYELKNSEEQKELFIKQLEFANENNLPVILHARGSKSNPDDAYLDIISIISNFQFLPMDPFGTISKRGVLHCFGSNREIAQKFLGLGFYIGFTGIITFKNKSVDELKEVVKITPLDKILIETDAPYLSPEPFRGEKNTPQNVEIVARKVAELKGMSYEEVCRQTAENFKKLFMV